MTTKSEVIAMIVVMVICIPIQFIGSGIAVVNLWGWFISPLGVPAIAFWHAFGITALVELLIPSISVKKNKDEKFNEFMPRVISSALSPFVALLIGWIFWKLAF